MASLGYRCVSLPRQWPGRVRPAGWKPVRSPFKSHNWSRIEKELMAELARVNAKDVTLAIDVQSSAEFREDGGLRSEARLLSQRVILSFTKGTQGVRLTLPCDAFGAWQDNVYAIRLTLENLRAIDRYGVTQGDQQYVGFAALPPAPSAEMSIDEAVALFASHAPGVDLLIAPDWMVDAVLKRARAATHPDAGGSTVAFQATEEASRILERHRSSSPPERSDP